MDSKNFQQIYILTSSSNRTMTLSGKTLLRRPNKGVVHFHVCFREGFFFLARSWAVPSFVVTKPSSALSTVGGSGREAILRLHRRKLQLLQGNDLDDRRWMASSFPMERDLGALSLGRPSTWLKCAPKCWHIAARPPSASSTCRSQRPKPPTLDCPPTLPPSNSGPRRSQPHRRGTRRRRCPRRCGFSFRKLCTLRQPQHLPKNTHPLLLVYSCLLLVVIASNLVVFLLGCFLDVFLVGRDCQPLWGKPLDS